MPHKRKIVLVKGIIFNKDKIWDSISFQYIADKIKKFDEVIQVIELL